MDGRKIKIIHFHHSENGNLHNAQGEREHLLGIFKIQVDEIILP